jgi:methyl-accepting chemotaxis protein
LEESLKVTNALQFAEEELRQNATELQEYKDSLQNQIQQSESEKKKNLAIMEGSVDAIIMFDDMGIVHFFNKAAVEIWEISRNSIIGCHINKLIPIQLELSFDDYFITNDCEGIAKFVDVRTEINCKSSKGNDLSLLFTTSKTKIGSEYTFAFFVQRISVELF